jgi:glycosyltransferase involved in cell wall biosynthesis
VLDSITVLILTFNEAANIERTLKKLRWARRVILVDSLSGDGTPEIAGRFENVEVFQRAFDSHANQWNFGLRETGIATEWVLALDADYVLTDEMVEEIKNLNPPPPVSAYEARFIYCVGGKPLRTSLYPPGPVLFRRAGAHYVQDGHTQRLAVSGEKRLLNSPIFHDDRKSFTRWFASQKRYQRLESEWIAERKFDDLGLADRLRKMRFAAPPAVFFYCLFVRGLFWDGPRGFYYSFERAAAELMLSFYLIRRDCQRVWGVFRS